jgi:hypothetical protein
MLESPQLKFESDQLRPELFALLSLRLDQFVQGVFNHAPVVQQGRPSVKDSIGAPAMPPNGAWIEAIYNTADPASPIPTSCPQAYPQNRRFSPARAADASEVERARLRKAFPKIDTDGTGPLDTRE